MKEEYRSDVGAIAPYCTTITQFGREFCYCCQLNIIQFKAKIKHKDHQDDYAFSKKSFLNGYRHILPELHKRQIPHGV
jgi:hypothetical protein